MVKIIIYIVIFCGILFGLVKFNDLLGDSIFDSTNTNLPRMQEHAKVISRSAIIGKKKNDVDLRKGENKEATYFISFHTDKGAIVEFKLPGEIGMRIHEGDQGLLEHQGTRFYGFAKD